ncbi:isoleucine--tRNA ligase, partial [Candidatus Woesearchaeota archaeon]|nr:isoleucine--tRNA ligase [Candidatus Woesearchaeota archaeon]
MTENIGRYDFKQVEEGIIESWEKNQTYPEIKKKGEGKEKFFFIQGPPYTSGRLHMGHAWNNTLKDLVLRYKRMRGFDVYDRAAYDMHGLPTAHKVMAEHNLKTKEDIIKFGMEKFIKECIKFCVDKAKLMDKDLWRLGVWMDFKNARYPIDNSYIEGVWFLIKKAHEKERLYEGLRTMSWCASCQTAMAKHECEYKEVKEPSIFVKFPVKGKEKEYLLIWTTTPWTIAYNLAIMVNPEIDYVKAKVGDEIWVIAKQLAAPVIQSFTEHTLEILEEFKGSAIEGLEYEHPWNNKWNHYTEIKAKHPKTHTILMSSEYVDVTAGTGLVHCAPGCGPEDYEIGHKNNIPAFNNLQENGVFPEDMAEFSGLRAKKDDAKFVEAMDKDGILIATTEVEHDYAHCERCHNPVVFRTTKQWFFKVEDLKEKMVKANENIGWIPEAGKNAFRSWLSNLRDNSITKQRFWGTPVPIWKCPDCSKYEVIGSALELKEKAGHCPENLHKPWIDSVELSCQCGSKMKRIPDVLDVWIDAGTLSWNILDYPSNTELYKKLWPADFILEAKEQIRGWFNMLMVTSIIAFDDPVPFLNCYMHGMLTDVEGKKMSKSIGNVLSPYEVIDKYGVDTLRLYTTNVSAGEDMNFSWDEIKLRHRNLSILWNMHKYLIEQSRLYDIKPKDITSLELDTPERYIISKTQSTLKKVTEVMDAYKINEIPTLVTDLFLELSRTYIQMTRDKANSSDEKEREVVLSTIHYCLSETVRMMSPLCPFMTEQIYQNLKEEFGMDEMSVHACEWSKTDESQIDSELENRFDIAKSIIQSILSAREKVQRGVRWPVAEAILIGNKEELTTVVEELGLIIQTQTNVKKLTLMDSFDKVTVTIKGDFGKMGPEFGEKSGVIVAKMMSTSSESILNSIEEKGVFAIEAGGETFELKRHHIIIKRDVPEGYVEGEFRNGFTYIDLAQTPELEAEGYAREISRKVQEFRKNLGLNKKDRISLVLVTDDKFQEILKIQENLIKKRTNSKKLEIVTT